MAEHTDPHSKSGRKPGDYPESEITGSQVESPEQRRREEKRETDQQMRASAEEVKKQSRESMERLRKEGEVYADARKDSLARVIDDIGDAVDSAADKLSSKQHEYIADYAHRTADSAHSLSRTLHDKSSHELLNEVNSFAHKQPAALIAGMFAAGVAISRFVKSGDYGEQPPAKEGY